MIFLLLKPLPPACLWVLIKQVANNALSESTFFEIEWKMNPCWRSNLVAHKMCNINLKYLTQSHVEMKKKSKLCTMYLLRLALMPGL